MNCNDNNNLKINEQYNSSFNSELLKGIISLSKDTKVPLTELLDKSIKMLSDSHHN